MRKPSTLHKNALWKNKLKWESHSTLNEYIPLNAFSLTRCAIVKENQPLCEMLRTNFKINPNIKKKHQNESD